MKNFQGLVAATVVFLSISGCSGRVESLLSGASFVEGQPDVAVQRAAYNQTAIQVRRAAPNEADYVLVEAQGFEEAKDRFFQMDMSRRLGRGTLAEIFGDKALTKDITVVAIGLREGLARKLESVQRDFPEEYRLLVSFSNGVNRFLSQAGTIQPALLQTYAQLTHNARYVPAAWEPADSLAVAQNIAFYLSSSIQEKLTLGMVALGILKAQATGPIDISALLKLPAIGNSLVDLRPIYNTFILDANAPAPRSAVSAGNAPALPLRAAGPVASCVEIGYPFPECHRPAGMGSNNFVVSPDFSGTGAAYLGNDPHLPLTFPMAFYELALDSKQAGGTIRARGLNLPGIPGILIGHNDDIAWGMTNLTADVDDIYFDVLDENGKLVVDQQTGGSGDLVIKKEKVRVRLADGSLAEQELAVRFVPHHGPIFSDFMDALKEPLAALSAAFGNTAVASYRWTGHEATQEYVAIVGVNRAHNFDEFKTSLNHFGAGAQNLVYADRKGNIGYYAHGNFPVRAYAGTGLGQWTPVLPTPGIGTYEWADKYRADVPQLYNPKSGRIVTANNDPYGNTSRGYKDYFGFGFTDGVRATRIIEILDGLRARQGRLSVDDLKAAQFDHKDLLALSLIDLMRKALPKLVLSESAHVLAQGFLQWDGDMNREKSEPVLVSAWCEELFTAYLAEFVPGQVRPTLAALSHTTPFTKTLYQKLKNTLAAKDATQALRVFQSALENTAKQNSDRQLDHKRWGEVNTVSFTNMLAGLLPTVQLPTPLGRDGYYETVDVSGPGFGPNFRLLLSVGADRPIGGIIAVPGGNFSTPVAAMEELTRWRDGGYRDLVPFIH